MFSLELKDKILQVIEANLAIEQFEEWLVPRLPVFLETPNSINANVVAAIELGLAEMSDGIRTEDEFLILLRNIIQEQEMDLNFSSPTSASNQTLQRTLDFTTTAMVVPL